MSSPRVLVTLIYMPAAYHDQLEIISTRLILVWPYSSFYGLAPTDFIRVFVTTQASYVQLPVGFSHN